MRPQTLKTRDQSSETVQFNHYVSPQVRVIYSGAFGDYASQLVRISIIAIWVRSMTIIISIS